MSRPRTPNPAHQQGKAALCQELATRLVQYRAAQTLTLSHTQAASQVPVCQSTWTRWETGQTFPDALVLMRLRTLGVDIPETWIGLVRHWKRVKMQKRQR